MKQNMQLTQHIGSNLLKKIFTLVKFGEFPRYII